MCKTSENTILDHYKEQYVKNAEGKKITLLCKGKGKGHPCTGTEALYRPYGP
jgi:hypothetical protein